ncbi:uncharacterized protein SAPINGB_P005200 [Magnusiomyces paraingens]|uniref:Uncharacterized protein n=1 Tax=Magnusiomyces paraingens TaxID=2606893 RepID=A0A5E8C4B4_9ASCO|nr:uncharacterized protein SAPINGB_P005200 [Saprochaete ingens]VVT56658.1 unnamed protein product [Saprochaete ingens]
MIHNVPTTLSLQPREARRAFRLHRRTVRSIISTISPNDKNRLYELAKVHRDKMEVYKSFEEQRNTKRIAIAAPHLQSTSRYPTVNAYLDSLAETTTTSAGSNNNKHLQPPKSIHNGPYLVSGTASVTATFTSSKNTANHTKIKASKLDTSRAAAHAATMTTGTTASSVKLRVPNTTMTSNTLPQFFLTGTPPAAPSRQPFSSGVYYFNSDHDNNNNNNLNQQTEREDDEEDESVIITAVSASRHHFQKLNKTQNEECSSSGESLQMDAYDSASEGFISADILNTSETIQHHPIIPNSIYPDRPNTTNNTVRTSTTLSNNHIPTISHFGEQWINTQRMFNYADREVLWNYPSIDFSASGAPITNSPSPSIHDSPFLSHIRRRHSQGYMPSANREFFFESSTGNINSHTLYHRHLPSLDSYSADLFNIEHSSGQMPQPQPLSLQPPRQQQQQQQQQQQLSPQQRLTEVLENSRSGTADINYTTINHNHSGFQANINSSPQDSNYQDFLDSFGGQLSANTRGTNTIPFFDTSLPSPYVDPYVDSPHSISETPINSAFIYSGTSGNSNTDASTKSSDYCKQEQGQSDDQPFCSSSVSEGNSANNTNSGNSLLQSDSPTSLMDSYRAIPQETLDTSPLYNTTHSTSIFNRNMNNKKDEEEN